MKTKTMLQKYGSWAIVTGASSGLGRGFAERLAQEGFNLVLIARRRNLLEELEHELQITHGIETLVIDSDLSSNNFMQALKKVIDSLDIGLLISNAGDGVMGAFSKASPDELARMNNLNVSAHTELGHYLVNRLLKQGRSGGLLFVSSTASLQGVAYGANYSASKAYILNLAEGLNYELKQKNIDVTALLPGPTSTPGFHERDDIDFNQMPMKPMPVHAVVNEGLKALTKNKPSHIVGRVNRIMSAMGKRFMSRKANINMWGGLMKKMTPKSLLA